jgi:tetratricopeptide (TPR) repeat protein
VTIRRWVRTTVGCACLLSALGAHAKDAGSGAPLSFEERSKAMDALSAFVETLADPTPAVVDKQLAGFVASHPAFEAAGYTGGNFWARFRDGRMLTIARHIPVPRPEPTVSAPPEWIARVRAGQAAADKGAWKTILSEFDQALAIAEKAGRESAIVAATLNLYASAIRRGSRNTDDYRRTYKLYERALAIEKKLLGPKHAKVASTLGDLGLMLGQANSERAVPTLKEALALCKALVPPNPDLEHEISTSLATLYDRMGRSADAKALRTAQDQGDAPRPSPPAAPDVVSEYEGLTAEVSEGHFK